MPSNAAIYSGAVLIGAGAAILWGWNGIVIILVAALIAVVAAGVGYGLAGFLSEAQVQRLCDILHIDRR